MFLSFHISVFIFCVVVALFMLMILFSIEYEKRCQCMVNGVGMYLCETIAFAADGKYIRDWFFRVKRLLYLNGWYSIHTRDQQKKKEKKYHENSVELIYCYVFCCHGNRCLIHSFFAQKPNFQFYPVFFFFFWYFVCFIKHLKIPFNVN